MQLDLEQLRDLLASLNQTDISELNLKGENFELVVRRGPESRQSSGPGSVTQEAPQASLQPMPQPMAISPLPPAPAAESPVSHPSRALDWVEIKSPMVGTFYGAPAPGEADFVAVGDKIKAGQTVCILEAMKLMNELESEVSGEVVEILVENGQPVEFDQPLMRVRTKD
ncbi:MAG: acetyl-CoA carboxylase biotin carboxyl carrier protein [Synechococcales cyanobacterium RM1_1_8]|nr:acetyl-CoA carboxylase biotin carboxyl carrier protein [Synechococcales cyanobacterium RM1_1_8]